MNNKTNKLFYLEGIRGGAACIVLIGHLKNIFFYDAELQSLQYLTTITHSNFIATIINSFLVVLVDGKLSVQVFWFMSAYVISIKLFGKYGHNYLKAAFIKRYFRLAIPALGSVLLAYGLLKLGFMYNIELARFSGRPYPSLTEMYNFKPDFLLALKSGIWDAFFDFKTKDSYNIVLWTMNPELYGSFFCFILFAVFKTRPNRYFIFLFFALTSLFLEYYWLVTFILSYMLCDIDHTSNRLKKISAYLIKHIFSKWYFCVTILLLLIIINGFGQQYYSAWVKIFVSAVFVFTVMNSIFLSDFFSRKILVWTGKISFSLYLIHIPVIYSLTCYLYMHIGLSHTYNALISSVITIIFVLAAAVVYTKFIDRPATVFSNKIANIFVKFPKA